MDETMAKRLDVLNNTKHDGILDFMRELQEAGFDNELDNGRVMKAINDKIDEMWGQVERQGSYCLTCLTRPHPVQLSQLVVTIHSSVSEDVKLDVILFVRPERDSIAVSRDVLGEEFNHSVADIPFTGTLMDMAEAEDYIKKSQRFNLCTLIAFRAVYQSLTAMDGNSKLLMRLTPTSTGLDVKYTVKGNKVSRMMYEYAPH